VTKRVTGKLWALPLRAPGAPNWQLPCQRPFSLEIYFLPRRLPNESTGLYVETGRSLCRRALWTCSGGVTIATKDTRYAGPTSNSRETQRGHFFGAAQGNASGFPRRVCCGAPRFATSGCAQSTDSSSSTATLGSGSPSATGQRGQGRHLKTMDLTWKSD